jgi:hypothetical protein
VAGIAVGQPDHIWRRSDAGLDGVGHFLKRQEIHVGHREPHRRDAGAGNKAGAEPGLFDQPRAHTVAATGHHLKHRLVEK